MKYKLGIFIPMLSHLQLSYQSEAKSVNIYTILVKIEKIELNLLSSRGSTR